MTDETRRSRPSSATWSPSTRSIIALVPYLPDELEMAAANIERPRHAGLLHRLHHAHQDRGEAGAPRRGRRRQAAPPADRDHEPRARSPGAGLEDPEPGPVGDGEGRSASTSCASSSRPSRRSWARPTRPRPRSTSCAQRIDEAQLPEDADKQARRELDRLAKLPSAAAEYGVIRTYLDWILSLPWNTSTEDDLDIAHARERPRRGPLRPGGRQGPHPRVPGGAEAQEARSPAPSSAFVGPPGVGKTSLGKSIARALGRKFIRISVGGVRDEAEIRGHRRTYIGAMPGTIIRAHPRRREQQPGVHDRRDRQDGLRLAGRPVERHARSARPRAAQHVPRPLPRPAVRPVEGHVHHHGQHARHHPRTAARPHGDHQASPATPRRRRSTSPGST